MKNNAMKEKFIADIKNKFGVNCGVSLMRDSMFHSELRAACECNTCGNFGKNYTCPPFVGNAEDCIKKVSGYKEFIAFNKIYPLEDSFDFEGMVAGQKDFRNVIIGVADKARETFDNPLILGAGGCVICEKCAALSGEPCRFPQKAISSLEANCIQVSQFAESCGLKYINGQNTMTYFGGVFLK